MSSDYAARVRAKYNSITEIWTDDDLWHSYIHSRIVRAVQRLGSKINFSDLVIDVGSGGVKQNIRSASYVQVDFAFERLVGISSAVCADVHTLPFGDCIADCVICVGPVVSYCSLVELVLEIGRIAKDGAFVLFHAELSNTFELLFRTQYRADAAFVNTFYKGEEQLWMYSHQNVLRTLREAKLRVLEVDYFHIASALAYRFTGRSNFASAFTWMDRLLRWMPGIGEISDSAIFLCQKMVEADPLARSSPFLSYQTR